jgi:hypothetical protein
MKRSVIVAALLLMGCGSAPTPGPKGPDAVVAAVDAPPVAAKADPWAVDGTLASEPLPAAAPSFAVTAISIPRPPKGIAPPPAICRTYAGRAPATPCADRAAALSALDAALAETDAKARDRALVGLEGCGHLPAGMVTALRAELAPVECSDVIVAAAVAKPPAGIDGVTYDALAGVMVAGMLSRASQGAPKLAPPYPKAKVETFIKKRVTPWVTEQAVAIEELSKVGAKLKYYGQAVVAVEAGMADMRFIDVIRSMPVPDVFEKDQELRETFLGALEDAFEPRKRRGRDAALVGLGRLATIGVIRDERVERARKLLSTMYGGSPIDALDVLLLPPLPPLDPKTPEQRLASRLPTFYASLLFDGELVNDAAMLRMFINKGLSLPHRIALAKADKSAEAKLLAARARFELGQNYWRAVDFDESVAALGSPSGLSEEGKLLLALGIALRGGPANAAEMMVKAPIQELGIGAVRALDAMVADGGALAGHAAFDAALIAQLSAPKGADAAYWTGIAERYRKAAAVIVDLPVKRDAEARAKEADEVAAAIQARPEAASAAPQ